MDRKLSVLLVEDDQDTCKDITEYTEEIEDLSLIGVTNNSKKAIEYVQDYIPDAVILDLELHRGAGNGISFLQDLRQLSIPNFPYVLVTTNNSSWVTYEYARKLGADFIMSKHQSGYSSQSAIDFINTMKEMILNRKSTNDGVPVTTESEEQKKKRLVRKICYELDRVGISPKAVGYKYLIDAISITIKKPQTNLCAVIAAKYCKTDSSVERAMQNAINRTWRTSCIDDLLMYYTAKINSEKGVPTITEFVFYYANKIKNEY